VPRRAKGRQITDYIIQTTIDGYTWTPVNDPIWTATTYTVGGLYPVAYWFRVAATNAVGIGPWSPTVKTIVLPL
jgi:Fibronectin type III domain